MKRKNILVTCVGSSMAYMIIKSLKNYNVIGVDMDENAVGKHFLRKFYCVKPGKEYNNEMLSICKSEKIDMVIPGADEEVFALASMSSHFWAAGIILAMPSNSFLYQSKDVMYRHLDSHNIDTPKWILIDKAPQLLKAVKKLGYAKKPVILKVAAGRGGRGVWKLTYGAKDSTFGRSSVPEKTLTEMLNILQPTEMPPMIVMENLEGDFYDVDILGKTIVTRKRINPVGIPFKGNVIEKNKEIIAISKKVQAVLNNPYLYDIDICLTTDGPKILEVNPRPSGSVAAMTTLGLNVYDLMVKRTFGIDEGKISIPFGKTVIPYTIAKEIK